MFVRDDTETLDGDFPLRMNKVWMRRKNYRFPYYHRHHYVEITYILEGRGSVSVNGRNHKVSCGDIVIFNEDEIHGWEVEADLQLFVLVFSSNLIFEKISLFDYEYLRFFEEKGSHFVNKIDKDEIYAKKIYSAMNDIYNEWIHEEPGRRLMMKAFVLRILTMLTRHYKNTPKDHLVMAEKNEQMGRLQTVLEYVSGNYGEKITLEQAAQKAYMSTTYFSGFFKKAMGETFSQYVTRLRIHKAHELLQKSDKNVIDIAQICGYNNMSNFYRAYKKIMGESPGKKSKDTEG